MTGLAVRQLGFSYGGPAGAEEAALHAVDLSVDPGEVLAVVGPSGSGKSTLLRLVSGLLQPTAGTVHVAGRDVTGLPPEARPVAMVFQGFALFPHLDVASNIGFGLAVRKASKAVRRDRVVEVADRLGLGDLLHRRPGELSGGERQRVALARALLRDPAVFCLDEPLSSLDPVLRTRARRDLDELLRTDGRCAVYVTHDQSEALTLGDRVAVVRGGRIEQVGTPRELYDRPASTFVASFIGSPPMALLPVGFAAGAGLAAAGLAGGLSSPVVTLGVRAEHVLLEPGDTALVVAVDDLGHEQVAELEVDGQLLPARLAPGATVRRGDRTGFRITRARGFDADGLALA